MLDYEKGCAGKLGYPTEQAAETTFQFMQARKIKHWSTARMRQADLHPYQCEFCGCWHMGH